MKKAYAYLRVSGKGQIKGDGFTRQMETINKAASLAGYEITKIYKEEGVSGTLTDRPALIDMMFDLEENENNIQTVFIEKMDRLARDIIVQETLIKDFQKNGFHLISALEGDDILSSDPTRKLIRQVLGAIAEYEKDMIVIKLRGARERKKRKTGKKVEGRKSYAEEKMETIKEIKRLYRKPRKGKRLSAIEIAERMNESGYNTATGKPFTDQIVRNILFKNK